MLDFFQALSDFLKSDLAIDYCWTIIVLIVICMILSGGGVRLFMIKVTLPSKIIDLNNRLAKMEELQKENDTLKIQIKELEEENEELKIKIKSSGF